MEEYLRDRQGKSAPKTRVSEGHVTLSFDTSLMSPLYYKDLTFSEAINVEILMNVLYVQMVRVEDAGLTE